MEGIATGGQLKQEILQPGTGGKPRPGTGAPITDWKRARGEFSKGKHLGLFWGPRVRFRKESSSFLFSC